MKNLEKNFQKIEIFDFSIFAKISIKKLFLQLLTQKNQFFGWFCAFFVLENFFIRLLVFSVRALENLHFSWFLKFWPLKISKIMKISKFQMLLDQPILKIFQYLKVRMKAEVLQFKNWETKFFSKRLQNQILKKKFFKKITTRKNENFDFSMFAKKSIEKLFLQLLTSKNQFVG